MPLPSRETLDAAARIVYRTMAPTPTHAWPLLRERLGTPIYLKHENHTPVGAFKLRGGLVYFDALRAREPSCPGVISATRGNRKACSAKSTSWLARSKENHRQHDAKQHPAHGPDEEASRKPSEPFKIRSVPLRSAFHRIPFRRHLVPADQGAEHHAHERHRRREETARDATDHARANRVGRWIGNGFSHVRRVAYWHRVTR